MTLKRGATRLATQKKRHEKLVHICVIFCLTGYCSQLLSKLSWIYAWWGNKLESLQTLNPLKYYRILQFESDFADPCQIEKNLKNNKCSSS